MSVKVSCSVGVLTRLRAGLPENRASMPGVSRQFSPPTYPVSGIRTVSFPMGSFPRCKAAGISSHPLASSNQCARKTGAPDLPPFRYNVRKNYTGILQSEQFVKLTAPAAIFQATNKVYCQQIALLIHICRRLFQHASAIYYGIHMPLYWVEIYLRRQ